MKRMISVLLCILFFYGCAEQASNSRGVYLLLDTSGTYTKELRKAQQIINYLLGTLGPGDTMAVARIDSASFSEKDIVAKVTFDSRPSVANAQKRKFAEIVNDFVEKVKGSQYTDISGGLFQAIEYLNEVEASNKHILIYSDLKEELPEGYNRNLKFTLDGFKVRALNVTKLRADNVNPEEYVDRLKIWQQKVETGGGNWEVVNDLDREDALML
ncbi:conserved exported hypothetical protein [Nitrospina gracilis 3/211]|uniref:VWFA domain-containing protein n=1 Tax=Nitrospina gracilis (strain 3/211) TaxID=1266370 RepID=M1YKQ9_NITG3|nr:MULTISPECIES: VWA domain-containing protein [Nitrospina]MCF8723966.1 uncharacterized protein with von Willebrand factor type A (vWA) domain [Nitrospina sp. Nb-3]CCQ91090.1 conserved exported hypothetical protein [Nitrospina gracilis 3/211]